MTRKRVANTYIYARSSFAAEKFCSKHIGSSRMVVYLNLFSFRFASDLLLCLRSFVSGARAYQDITIFFFFFFFLARRTIAAIIASPLAHCWIRRVLCVVSWRMDFSKRHCAFTQYNDFVLNSDNLAHVNCRTKNWGDDSCFVAMCVCARSRSDSHFTYKSQTYVWHFLSAVQESTVRIACGRSHTIKPQHIVQSLRATATGERHASFWTHINHAIELIVVGECTGFVLCQCLVVLSIFVNAWGYILVEWRKLCLLEVTAVVAVARERWQKSQRLYIFFNTKESPISRHVNRIDFTASLSEFSSFSFFLFFFYCIRSFDHTFCACACVLMRVFWIQ